MQFSNDVRVEVPLGAHEEESFGKAMTDMVKGPLYIACPAMHHLESSGTCHACDRTEILLCRCA